MAAGCHFAFYTDTLQFCAAYTRFILKMCSCWWRLWNENKSQTADQSALRPAHCIQRFNIYSKTWFQKCKKKVLFFRWKKKHNGNMMMMFFQLYHLKLFVNNQFDCYSQWFIICFRFYIERHLDAFCCHIGQINFLLFIVEKSKIF